MRGGVDAQQYVVQYRGARPGDQVLTGSNQVAGVGAFSKVVQFGRTTSRSPGGDRKYVGRPTSTRPHRPTPSS
ncbi:hypothetical protein ACRAWD_29570 [Caulobacter segnis]